jgi:serine/threonine protein kinase
VKVSDDQRVGTELAGYRIESLLGIGGMSVVYLAEDLRLKRRVALKLLSSSLAEDERSASASCASRSAPPWRELQRGRDDARHGGRERREALERHNRRRARPHR